MIDPDETSKQSRTTTMFIVLFFVLAVITMVCLLNWATQSQKDRPANVLYLNHIQTMIEECPRLSAYVMMKDMDNVITVNEYFEIRNEYAEIKHQQTLRNLRNTYR